MKMKTRRMLKNWAVSAASAYTAPECRGNPSLVGTVPYSVTTVDWRGHESTATNKQIITGKILSVKKRHVVTQSGEDQRTYVLCGDPHPKFLEFLEGRGMSYDKTDPLRAMVEHNYILMEEK